MKYLIGLLFCLMLFTVGRATAQEKISTKEASVCTCGLDIGKYTVNIDGPQNRFFELFAKANDAFEKNIDMKKLKEVSRIASIKAFDQIGGHNIVQKLYKENDALLTRYRYVPDCPIVFVRSNYFKYTTQYSYSYIILYNQSPSV
jgi:hypothetical protein